MMQLDNPVFLVQWESKGINFPLNACENTLEKAHSLMYYLQKKPTTVWVKVYEVSQVQALRGVYEAAKD